MRSKLKETQTNNSNIYDKNQSDFENVSALKGTNSFDNMKVAIRVRPPLPRELEVGLAFRSIALVSDDFTAVSLVEYLGAEMDERERQREWAESPNLFQLHRFTFDYVFDMDSTQDEVYIQTAKPAVMSVLEGYNSTIFAYGQTGTGKTYTMEGFTYNSNDPLRGIVPRSIDEIFTFIESFSSCDTTFMVRASYLQIYNEYTSDLLKPEKKNLQIREDKKRGVFVDQLSEWAVRSPSDIYTLLQRGALSRATASTCMNDVSSRSHAVFVITVEQMTMTDDGKGGSLTQIKVGKLNLVDLAGSERISLTGATGKQLDESRKINKSLSALGNVIYALTDIKGRTHIPYRDSKLTRLLEDSLGGNCKTTMMAMISPAHESFNESLSSLHFARRAKHIKNRPVINEDVDHRALIREYEIELKKLRVELDEKNRQLKSNELVIELEEQKKRAEEDKNAAIIALEQASQQYLQERDEKKRLEMKIQIMNSQMIVGGHKIEDTPQFRSALEERQTILLKEFDQKLQEFEKERQQIEEEKAQVERYKQLLLKQRDIMIALTTKLNERDEAIVQLQEEVDAYDKINHEQEEAHEINYQRICQLENLLKRNSIKIPSLETNEGGKILRRSSDKMHIPYEAERNFKQFENAPMTLLSSDEKIKELKNILKDQEKEINILKLVSQKFISSAYEGKQISIDELIKNSDHDYELNLIIRDLEEEKKSYIKEIEEKNEALNTQRQENDALIDQISQLEKSNEKLEVEKSQMLKIKDEVLGSIDSAMKKKDSSDMYLKTLRNDIGRIFNSANENYFGRQRQNEQSETRKLSDERNYSQDDICNDIRDRKTNNGTQSFAKYRQSQQASANKSNGEQRNQVESNSITTQQSNNQYTMNQRNNAEKKSLTQNISITPPFHPVKRDIQGYNNIQYFNANSKSIAEQSNVQQIPIRSSKSNSIENSSSGFNPSKQYHHSLTQTNTTEGKPNQIKASSLIGINPRLKSENFINKFINSTK